MQPKFAVFALIFILLLSACSPAPTAAPILTATPTPAPTATSEPIAPPADIQALIAQNAAQSAGTQKAEWHLLSGTDPEPVGAAIPKPDDPTQSEFKLAAANGEFITGVSGVEVVYANDKAVGLLAHTDSGLYFENGADGKPEWQPLAFSPAAKKVDTEGWNFVVDEAGNQYLIDPNNPENKLTLYNGQFLTQAEYIKATFSIDEWKSLDDSARAQWFEKNAADLGIKFSEWDKWQVLGGSGLVKLTAKNGQEQYFSVIEARLVTEDLVTPDDWRHKVFVGTMPPDFNGWKAPLDNVWNDSYFHQIQNPNELLLLPPLTELIAFKLNGEVLIWFNPEEAYQLMEEGAMIMSTKEGGGPAMFNLAIAAAWNQHQQGGEKVWVQVNEFKDAGYLRAVRQGYDFRDFRLMQDEQGRWYSPILARPKWFCVGTGDNRVDIPGEDLGEYWFDEAVRAGADTIWITSSQESYEKNLK